MTGRGNGAGGTLAVEAGTNPARCEDRHVAITMDFDKASQQEQHLDDVFPLLVFLGDHLFTSIQRLGNERRETLDVGFEDRLSVVTITDGEVITINEGKRSTGSGGQIG